MLSKMEPKFIMIIEYFLRRYDRSYFGVLYIFIIAVFFSLTQITVDVVIC